MEVQKMVTVRIPAELLLKMKIKLVKQGMTMQRWFQVNAFNYVSKPDDKL